MTTSATSATGTTADPVLSRRLAALQQHYSGQFSVAARNLATGEEILVDPHRTYPTASTFKVPIMVEVFRQVEAGDFALDDRVDFKESDIVHGSGVLRDLQPGLNPTIHDLLTLMIIVSDNTATNMLIDKVGGVEPINKTMADLGFTSIDIKTRIDFERIAGDNRALAVASPWDLMQIMTGIVQDTMISASASAAMREILGRQHYLGQATRYLGYNPYAEETNGKRPLWVGSKTGSLKGMRADTGIWRLGNGTDITFAVMNEGCSDPGFGSEYEGDIVNGILGWIVLSHWWPTADLGPMPGGKSPYLDAVLGDLTQNDGV